MTDVGYDAFDDPYCYKGTGVLRNTAGLRNAEALEAFELEMSTLRSEESLPEGRFGPAPLPRGPSPPVSGCLFLGGPLSHRPHVEGRQSLLLSRA